MNRLETVLGNWNVTPGRRQLNPPLGFWISIDLNSLFGHSFTSPA
jgi:hypothetical protein